MLFQVKLHVMLKSDVADVQGAAIQQSLVHHGEKISGVKVGKYFEFELEAEDEATAKATAERLARDVFSNPVIENHWFEIETATRA